MKRILCLWIAGACGLPADSCVLPADSSAAPAGDAHSAYAKQSAWDARQQQSSLRSRPRSNFQHGLRFGVGCGDIVPGAAQQSAERQSWPTTLHQLAQLCRQFSPTVGVIGADAPDSLLLDVTGTAHLFGGEAALAEQLAGQIIRYFAGDPPATTKQPGSDAAEVYGAIADTPGGAWAVAHWCRAGCWPAEWMCGSGRLVIVPPGRTPAALRRLPIQALRAEGETVEMLNALAIRWIGQLEALPRGELAARFGQRLLDRLDQALGRLAEPILPLESPPSFAAELTLCYPTGNREYLEAILQQLLCQVSGQLREAGSGAMQLRCELRCGSRDGAVVQENTAVSENRSGNRSSTQTLRLELGLFEPLCDATQLFQLLSLQMERLRLPGPVSSVHVEATITARLPQQQPRLFVGETAGGDRRQLAVLINRLCSRLGWHCVLGVQLQPEAQPELAFCYVPLIVPSLADPKGTALREHLPRLSTRQQTGGRASVLCEKSVLCENMSFSENISHAATNPGRKSGCVHIEMPVRPLRLLRQPVAVESSFAPSRSSAALCSETQRTAEDSLPPQFRWQGRLYCVRYAWGPERIETGWWRGRPVGRAYYQIETITGCRLWMFRQLGDGRWFVHGLFD